MSYMAKCVCGLSRTYSTTGQAKASLDAAHERSPSAKERNCVRTYTFTDKESGKTLTPEFPAKLPPLKVIRGPQRKPKAERNHKPENINFCPRCGFSMEVLRVASRVAERL